MTSRTACTLLVLTLAASQTVRAQETGFALGQLNAGAVVGFGAINGAPLLYGLRIEKAAASLEDLDDATLGVQFIADRYAYRITSADHKYTITHTTYALAANYHLYVENRRWDPFVGLGLGHEVLTEKARDFGPPVPFAKSAGVFYVVRAGLRYYYTPRVAAYANAGTGSASVNFGATYKIK